MIIGTPSNVNVREVWPNEANDFTPWLAENLEQLSDATGTPLTAEATEVEINGLYTDMVAVNPDAGKHVLIENQLETTDANSPDNWVTEVHYDYDRLRDYRHINRRG